MDRNKFVNTLLNIYYQDTALVKMMKEKSHNYDEFNLNPYHIEGDIHTHTMMVLRKAEEMECNKLVLIAALLHDIGKPDTFERKGKVNVYQKIKAFFTGEKLDTRKRISFFMHEPYSAYKSLGFMNRIPDLSKEDKIHIFKLISLHTDLFRLSEKNMKKYVEKYMHQPQLVRDLISLGEADALGRIVDETVSPQKGAVAKMKELGAELVKRVDVEKVELEKKPEAIILIGLPLSGKSTYVKKINGYKVLSRDKKIMEVANSTNYNKAYKLADRKLVNTQFQEEIQSSIKSQENLVFDLTNMSRKRRKKLCNNLKQNKYKTTARVLLVDLEETEKRNKIRSKKENKSISKKVIEDFIKSFYPPLYDDFDEIEYILNN